MFICVKCHKKYVGKACFFNESYGPCEMCNKTSACTDCHCAFKPKAERKEKK